jgi:pimeloyl-ACP methyl ester carboxylesterase
MGNVRSLQHVSGHPGAAAFGIALLALVVVALAPAQAGASGYHVVESHTTTIDLPLGKLWLTETVVQDGPLAIDRFTVHRLRRPFVPHRGTLLLLPSNSNSFQIYLFHESGDVTRSFAAFFARLGYDVWGYSPRTTGIAAGACGTSLDCSPALGWSLQTIVDDATFIRSKIQAVSPGAQPVVGGLSLGAISALAVVNQHPNDYGGLIAWEGTIVTDDPAVRAYNLPFCNQFSALVAAGVAVDDQTSPFVKLVSQLAQTAPGDPFMIPVPGFPPGLTNHQAFVLIMSTPNPFAPAPRPGFIAAAGDVATDQLFFSDDARLMANIAVFDDVTSNRLGRDLYCSLAGVETSHSANLASFTAPTLIIKGGRGFGPVMDELAGKLGSTSIDIHGMDEFGHVDHLGSPDHWSILEAVIADWLD